MTAAGEEIPRTFYHGTRAALQPGDLIAAGYSSHYGKRKQASWVYLTGTIRSHARVHSDLIHQRRRMAAKGAGAPGPTAARP